MYDQNATELIGTIVEQPKFKKTENTGKSKVDFVMRIHRPSPATTFDRIYITAWEKVADEVDEHFHQGDRIWVKGKINVNSYKDGETYHFFTRVIADEVGKPKEEKGNGFGYVKFEERVESNA